MLVSVLEGCLDDGQCLLLVMEQKDMVPFLAAEAESSNASS